MEGRDIEHTEFSFEDTEKHLTVWFDGYASEPDNCEPEWSDSPHEYRNAIACGHFGATKDGVDEFSQLAPSWISTWDLAHLRNLVDDFADGIIDGFNLFPIKGMHGETFAPIRFAMCRRNGASVVKVVVDGIGSSVDYSLEQVLDSERLKAFRTYLSRLVEWYPAVD